MSRVCSKCNISKSSDRFYVPKTGPRKGRAQAECKDCRALRMQRWRDRNPNAWRDHYRKARLKWKYGLLPEDVPRVGFCPICERSNKKLVIDHCHKTDVVRGFICYSCNTLLGHIENTNKMKRIEQYLNATKV